MSSAVIRLQATRSLERLFAWGIDLRVWVSICVAGLTLFARQILHRSTGQLTWFEFISPAITFCATLCLYNLDGLIDGRCVGKTRTYHQLITVLSGCLTIFLASLVSRWLLLLVIGGMLLCALYAIPLGLDFRSNSKPRGIKSIPGLKAPFVGFSVALAVVLVPSVELLALATELNNVPSVSKTFLQMLLSAEWKQDLLLTFIFGCLCTQNTLLCDIPDMQEDQLKGAPTVLLRFGHFKQTLLGLVLCSIAYVVAQLTIQSHFAKAGCCILAVTLLSLSFFLSRTLSRRAMTFIVDGALLLPCLFYMVFSNYY